MIIIPFNRVGRVFFNAISVTLKVTMKPHQKHTCEQIRLEVEVCQHRRKKKILISK